MTTSTRTSSSTRTLLIAIMAVLGVALAIAMLGGGDAPAPTTDPSDDAGAAAVPITLDGPSLADGEASGPSPVVTGPELSDRTVSVTVPVAGRPTMIVFLAHWCSHCNAEVPVIMEWLDAGGLPEGVALRGVATGIDPAAPNHPPAQWLAGFGWDVPTVEDDAASRIAAQFGLTGFPYWVLVDADGQVVDALSGELTREQLDEVAARIAAT